MKRTWSFGLQCTTNKTLFQMIVVIIGVVMKSLQNVKGSSIEVEIPTSCHYPNYDGQKCLCFHNVSARRVQQRDFGQFP